MQLWQVRDAGVAWEDLDGLSGVVFILQGDRKGRFVLDGDTLRFKEDEDGFTWEAADRSFWNDIRRTYCAFIVTTDLLDLLGA